MCQAICGKNALQSFKVNLPTSTSKCSCRFFSLFLFRLLVLLFIMLAVFYATDTFGEITIITDERTDTTGCNTLPADAFGRKGGGDVVAVRSYTYSDALALLFL